MKITDYATSVQPHNMIAHIDGYGNIQLHMNDALVTFTLDGNSTTVPWPTFAERIKHMLEKASMEINRRQYTRVFINGETEVRGEKGMILLVSKLRFSLSYKDLQSETPREQRHHIVNE